MSTIELNVQGMSCGSCIKHVTEALQPLAGVDRVEVDLQSGLVRISGSPDTAALLIALNSAGYPAQLATTAPPAGLKSGGGGSGCCCK